MWPQYVYLGLVILGLGFRIAKHPEKIEIGFGSYIFGLFVSIFLLYSGGFFDRLLK